MYRCISGVRCAYARPYLYRSVEIKRRLNFPSRLENYLLTRMLTIIAFPYSPFPFSFSLFDEVLALLRSPAAKFAGEHLLVVSLFLLFFLWRSSPFVTFSSHGIRGWTPARDYPFLFLPFSLSTKPSRRARFPASSGEIRMNVCESVDLERSSCGQRRADGRVSALRPFAAHQHRRRARGAAFPRVLSGTRGAIFASFRENKHSF